MGAAWSQQIHRHAAGDASGQRRVLPSAAAAIVQLEARVSLKRFDSIAAIGSRASRACRRRTPIRGLLSRTKSAARANSPPSADELDIRGLAIASRSSFGVGGSLDFRRRASVERGSRIRYAPRRSLPRIRCAPAPPIRSAAAQQVALTTCSTARARRSSTKTPACRPAKQRRPTEGSRGVAARIRCHHMQA